MDRSSQTTGKDEKKGLIFNIQRFSVHDGPGIRTTVFLKGCPLSCLWCANPESQLFFPNLMVREINCRGCGACLLACLAGAITLEDGKRRIDRDRCDHCLKCVDACLYQSLNACGKYVGREEVLEEVFKDSVFYKNSSGGVTVSGGEPLYQAEFTAALLAGCKKAGLHTALDTTGHAPWEAMEEVLRFTDLVLFDVKHLDPAAHRRGTGVDNRLILENLMKISGRAVLWLRVPVIPGFNDSGDLIRDIADLGKRAGAEKISLLPYHEGGRSKCDQIGKAYRLPETNPPGEDLLNRLKGIVEEAGIRAAIRS